MNLEYYDRLLHAAVQAMAEAVNTEFPIGSVVEVDWGGRKGRATVAIPAYENCLSCQRIGVRCIGKAQTHWKHFSDVTKVGESGKVRG
jgi:hypothetical protein